MEINSLTNIPYKIFVASDEMNFFQYLNAEFPGKIFAYDNTEKYRGSYSAGETALIDCVLLSRCNLLIKTSSNLSLASTYFNPEIRVIELNERLVLHGSGYGLRNPYSYDRFNFDQKQALFDRIAMYLGPRNELGSKD